MRLDREYIPIALIIACLIIWLSSKPWEHIEAVQIAGDIVKVSFGGVLGYMVKSAIDELDTNSVLQENRRLRETILNTNEYDQPTQSEEYIEGP